MSNVNADTRADKPLGGAAGDEVIATKPHPGGIAAALETKRVDEVFQHRLPAGPVIGENTFEQQVTAFDEYAAARELAPPVAGARFSEHDFTSVNEYPLHKPSPVSDDPDWTRADSLRCVDVMEERGKDRPGDIRNEEAAHLVEDCALECDVASLPTIEESVPVDRVHHPTHYNQSGRLECIIGIREALGAEGFRAYCRGNVLKYTWRADHKGEPLEDMAKAAVYARWAAGEELP